MTMRPLVAVTGRPTAAGRPWRLPGVGSQVNYLEALERAGALGAVLQPVAVDEDDMAERLSRFDGLLLIGGADVDPELYGQERHPSVYGENPEVDHFEMVACQVALAAGVPVLAICRGMQVLNVALGGTLHQHITDWPEGCDHGEPGVSGGRARVDVQPSSLLAAVMGTTEANTSCFHHQALDALGQGLVASAWTADGIVEAVELEDRGPWLLAVQWHPETVAASEPEHQAIFNGFVAACETYRDHEQA
ncbi:MAG: putative glutamine amidotransferase [Acidimicrobiia bacterium]|jgi:putative glutamine amidotransferase|nr:putative glutamine amidotransferase [Acidimicrobiia bacterium]